MCSYRNVFTCNGNLSKCVFESAFCLGLSDSDNMLRVRILMRNGVWHTDRLFGAYIDVLNAFLRHRNFQLTYSWNVTHDPLSMVIDQTEGRYPNPAENGQKSYK